jgi:hypothetical protein
MVVVFLRMWLILVARDIVVNRNRIWSKPLQWIIWMIAVNMPVHKLHVVSYLHPRRVVIGHSHIRLAAQSEDFLLLLQRPTPMTRLNPQMNPTRVVMLSNLIQGAVRHSVKKPTVTSTLTLRTKNN